MKGKARDNNPKWLGKLETNDDGRNGPNVRKALSNSAATIAEEEESVKLRKRGGKVR
jgi:hypothetical protein